MNFLTTIIFGTFFGSAILFVALWLPFAIGARNLAIRKGNNAVLGFVLGLLLGPVGAFLVWTMRYRYSCIRCDTDLRIIPEKCPGCGLEFSGDAKHTHD